MFKKCNLTSLINIFDSKKIRKKIRIENIINLKFAFKLNLSSKIPSNKNNEQKTDNVIISF